MPRLMGKQDWMQTVADMGTAESVWYENIVGDALDVPFPLPEAGRYRVIFVKLADVQNKPTDQSISRPRHRDISPRVRALRGSAKLNDNRDYKEILAEAAARKYETLG